MAAPDFRLDFDAAPGEAVEVAPGVRRVTANNKGPFTFKGTNSYIVGHDTVAVIDPGPPDAAHLEALLAAIGGRKVSHILVSHTHMDHSPLARVLREKVGGLITGASQHSTARDLHFGEINPLDASVDRDHEPDHGLFDGDRIDGDGFSLTAIATPGHTANHLAFALDGTGILFSADHVMAWSTTIVAPPDGSMSDYMASLDRLLERDDTVYFPGHGGRVTEPHKFVRGLKAHRKMRERAIIGRLAEGDTSIKAVVAAIYRDTDPRLHGAAALSVLAHLEDLVARKVVSTESGRATINETYRLAAPIS